MQVVLMEFTNGGDVEAEVFENTNAMKQWFCNDYHLDDNETEEIISQINNRRQLKVGNFEAVVYYRYSIHMEIKE